MTRPGIEPRSPGPLANTLLTEMYTVFSHNQDKPLCIQFSLITRTNLYGVESIDTVDAKDTVGTS